MSVSSPPRVLCCGEALLDRFLPAGSEAGGSVLSSGEDQLGGAPANVACGLARLGTEAAFLGRLGSDAIGAAFSTLFAQRGVDTSALQWDLERPTRIVLVRRDGSGERSFGGFLGDRGSGFADQAADPHALLIAAERLLPRARWLLCGTLALASPRAAAAQEALLALATAAPAAGPVPALAVDLNWRPTFWGFQPGSAPSAAIQARVRPLLERASLLKCAVEEARWFFATEDPAVISAQLPGRPAVCVTDGSRPLRWCIAGRVGRLEPFAIAPVDTTGAGDAFLAGLLHGLVRADAPIERVPDPERLIRFAAACGALVCLGRGAIDPQPDAARVERFLAERGGAPILALPQVRPSSEAPPSRP